LITEVIEQKFHLAAALKAEHVLHDWALTETAWTHSHRPRSGPFEFEYDYQRADLEVRGPSFYGFEKQSGSKTVYTGSGMAAISALLMAMASIFPEADIVTMPNSYGETAELIDGHAKHLRRIELGRSLAESQSFADRGPGFYYWILARRSAHSRLSSNALNHYLILLCSTRPAFPAAPATLFEP
jgi:hypothetical protein